MAKEERRNLILLTVDAWRADFVDSFEGIPLLPILNEIADHSVRFDNFYANAPWTTPALISLLTGESPARHGVFYQWSVPREDTPALGKRLGAAGYALPNVSYLNNVNGYQHLGFGPCPLPDIHYAANDNPLLHALRQHRDHREPFFLWYHYKHLHFPYWAGDHYRHRLGIDHNAVPQRLSETVCTEWNVPRDKARFPASDRDWLRRLYAAEVLELNDFLRPIVEELLKNGLLDRTTFVLTSDHADEHLEHGHVGHASTAEHGTLYEEVLRVPLIVADSRIGGPRTLATRAQAIDLYSTLLSLAGLPTSAGPGTFDFSAAILDPAGALPPPDRTFYFHSARMGFRTPPEMAGQIVEAVSDGKTKFIAERYDATRFLLFDLERDPGEQNPAVFREGHETPDCQAALAGLMETRSRLAGGRNG